MGVLHVDCDQCMARGPACEDCVMTVLLGPPHAAVDLDSEEQATLSALAEQGLVPPLRLIAGARPARSVSLPSVEQDYA
jgi:hypothetical protein